MVTPEDMLHQDALIQSDRNLRDEFLNSLMENDEVIVVFNKKSGETRTMRCTTRLAPTPEAKFNEDGTPKERKPFPDNVKPVWDLEANAWRMVNLDKILSVSHIGE